MQSPWAFKARHLRAHFSGGGLKSWGARCGFQTPSSWRRSSGCWASFRCGSLRGAIPRLCLSLSYQQQCKFFLIYQMCRSHSASFLRFFCLFPEALVLYIPVDSVWSWELMNSGSSHVSTLIQNPLFGALPSAKPSTPWAPHQTLWTRGVHNGVFN